jgi:hypothetical protein
VRAKVAAPDQFAAIDAAVAKLEHQLTKLKSRLVTYTKGKARAAKAGGHVGAGEAAALIGAPSVDGDAAVTPSPTDLERVVKRKRFAMLPMTIDEAVLQMELLAHQFFVFVLAETGEPAVLYQRDDGDIGMIEVEQTPVAG